MAVKESVMELSEVREALLRIQMEYTEMPEMKLTLPQARRLMNLPLDACEVALATLVQTGFLVQSRTGAFLLARSDSSSTPPALAVH
jgi:hypothetical protein